MVRMFNCGRSFSNHIEKKKSKCDYHFNRNLNPMEINELENRVNEVIRSDLEITEKFYLKEDALKIFNLSRLPDNAGDSIRVIKIGDYDECPCSGLHVSHTQEIGVFKIVSTSFEKQVLRIRFKLQEQN
jgi:Ser-tRNA(Ala) deacylase AlaX